MKTGELSGQEAVEKLREMIKDIDFTMFTTEMLDGRLRSRPMSTQKEVFDGKSLWFFTHADDPKVDEIQDDADVCLGYSDNKKMRYVSVTGKGYLVRDQAKIDELWNPMYEAWFPKGKDDPNTALIRVDVEEAEYWESPGMIRFALSFVKSLVTDTELDAGENMKIDLDHGQPA